MSIFTKIADGMQEIFHQADEIAKKPSLFSVNAISPAADFYVVSFSAG